MARKQFFSNKIIAQIKEQISILDIATEHGLTPIQIGDHYSLKEHDSVIIYPQTNTFFRHKNSVGGDVFTFVKEIEEINISFKDFYFHCLNRIDRSKEPTPIEERTTKPKNLFQRKNNSFDLNESLSQCENRQRSLLSKIKIDKDFRNVRAFLIQTRKIDSEIVNQFIEKGLIKQGYIKKEDNSLSKNKVAFFIGYNDVGIINAINVKSTSSYGGFKGDLSGCNYAYGWRYDPDIVNYKELYKTEFYNTDKPLICFEGYIDMMAYISSLKDIGVDYKQFAYITCGSTTKYRSVVATCLTNRYSKIICAFDNDEAGDIHALILAEEIKKECGEHIIITRQKSRLKDWDEDRQKGIIQNVDSSYFKENIIQIDDINNKSTNKIHSIKEMSSIAKKKINNNKDLIPSKMTQKEILK